MPCIAIVGAGFSGLGAAARLVDAGFDELVIFERRPAVGGTWHDNTYPGAACDIPAHLYSFSFAPKADWTTVYPRQAEIAAYLEDLTDRFDLRRFLRTGAEVTGARFDESRARWHLHTRGGDEEVADVVIGALGPLTEPSYPAFPGRDDYAGPQVHTARWDHGVNLEGARIGVVGTGSSGVQVVPPLAERAARLTVFQRSAPWVIPMLDRSYSRAERWAFTHVPGLRRLYRALLYWQKEVRFAGFERGSPMMRAMESYARWNMRRHIDDPDLRRALTPAYRMGCKRIVLSSTYYPTLARDDVDLVTDPIERVTPDGIRTAAGDVGLDAIVYATGFRVADLLAGLTVTGLGGRDLGATLDDRPAAYYGTSVPGFPNLFLMLGPNTGLGHNSMTVMMEAEYRFILGAIERLRDPALGHLDVREEAVEAFRAEVTARNERTVWASGCNSWYLDEDGYNFTLWPGYTFEFRRRTRRFHPEAYRHVTRAELPRGEAATSPPRAHGTAPA